MWVVRLAHPVVNRFRVIAEPTREAAEKKAADQIKAWDAGFSTVVPLSSGSAGGLTVSTVKSLYNVDRRQSQLAEQLTAQVQEETLALRTLLLYGSLVKYSVTPPTPPKLEEPPPEPEREAFAIRPTFADYVIPRVRKQKHADAEQKFAAAHAAWDRFRSEVAARNREREENYQSNLRRVEAEKAAYHRREPAFVAAVCRLLLNASVYPHIAVAVPGIATREMFAFPGAATEHPDTFPRTFELDYTSNTRTVVVDYELPSWEAMPSVKGYKHVVAGDKVVPVPAPRPGAEEIYESVLYQVTLRTIFELFRWDEADALDSVVFNGWAKSIDMATGKETHGCVLTVQAGKREFLEINLAAVDPKACFRKLKGISGAKLAALSPVRPILQMNREDKRFVSARPVIDALDGSTNLAAMEWEDFEQLIRDVFEKEFSADGGEVKITRASRDHGVDAVAFDPDPIRGGKIVIQAKRYTDTVSVSAVRDLYGTILNEGANKGILVTTADYGADAYEFAKGKPITLLSGGELLYLLHKHGRKARIDLAEARALAKEAERKGQPPA